MRIDPLCVWLSTLSTALAASVQLSPVVNLGYAKIQGTFNATTSVTEFLGIRFAAPPVGKLRFQAPQKPLQQQGVQTADVEAPACPQGTIGAQSTSPFKGIRRRQMNVTEIEDCLFLNVHVSGRVNPIARMPVVFWIHGGGYDEGSAIGFDGSDLIREAGGGIVAVEVQYRLGIFGFTPGREMKKNGAVNLGILDQNAALEWVHANIQLFGGDPSHVTLWGESAGAGSAMFHIIAHQGNTQPPLFLQAMFSSLPALSIYNFDDPVPEFLFSEVANLAGCTNATNVFACLVEAPAALLNGITNQVSAAGFFGSFTFIPVVDGDFIVERPSITLQRGRVNGHALLAVTNTFEGTIFVSPTIEENSTLTQFLTEEFLLFNAAQVQQVVGAYEKAFSGIVSQAINVLTESIFVCPTHLALSAFPNNGRKGEFAIPPGTHGSDIVYYFPSMGTPPFSNAQFDASFAGGFMGFAKFGDPNRHTVSGIITPEWPLFSSQRPVEMLFNRTEDLKPDIHTFETDQGLLARCAMWNELAPVIPQ